jgi:hypothetical protein
MKYLSDFFSLNFNFKFLNEDSNIANEGIWQK